MSVCRQPPSLHRPSVRSHGTRTSRLRSLFPASRWPSLLTLEPHAHRNRCLRSRIRSVFPTSAAPQSIPGHDGTCIAPTPASSRTLASRNPRAIPGAPVDTVEQSVAIAAPAATRRCRKLPKSSRKLEPEVQTAALITPPPREEVLPRSDVQAVGYPRLDAPKLSAPAAMPADEIACRRELKRLGVIYRDLPPIDDGGVMRYRLSCQSLRAFRAVSK